MWSWNWIYDLENIIRHIFYAPQSFVSHFIGICGLKLNLSPGNVEIGNQIGDILVRVALKLHGWPWKTTEILSCTPWSFVHHLIAIFDFFLGYRAETLKLEGKYFYVCDLDLWPPTLTFCSGNYSWQFHDDTTGTLWKRCDKQTDRQTDGRTDQYSSALKVLIRCSFNSLAPVRCGNDFKRVISEYISPNTCRLNGAKPLSKPMLWYYHMDP